MIRHALLELRQAVADDFKDQNNYPLYGAVFFIQNCNLSIDKKIYYLMPETNKVEFRELFQAGRIFTFANPGEVLKVSEMTIKEWNEEFAPVTQNKEL